MQVDTRDPFFFDHPLSHIPGMLLLAGLLDSASDLIPVADWGRVGLEFAFRRPAPLGSTTHMKAVGQRDFAAVELAATQGSQTVCSGNMRVGLPVDDGARLPVSDDLPGDPIVGALVHRRRLENIMIGSLLSSGSHLYTTLVEPQQEHRYDSLRHPERLLERIIEAVRQLCTCVMVRDSDEPLAVQLILTGVKAELPSSLPPGTALAMRCTPPPSPVRVGQRVTIQIEILDRTTGRQLGWAEAKGCKMTPEAHARFFKLSEQA